MPINILKSLRAAFIKPSKPTGSSIMKMLDRAASKGHHIGGPMADPSVYEKFAQAIAPFAERDVSFLGSGVEHNVFDIGGGKIAKIGYGGPSTLPNLPEVLKPISTIPIGKHTAYIMPKVETSNISKEHVTRMSKSLAQRGWAFDAHTGNLGMYRGRTYIIDHGGMRQMNKMVMEQGRGQAASLLTATSINTSRGSRTLNSSI